MAYSKANFEARLAEGNKTEKYVAERLVAAGVIIVIPEYPEGMPTSYYTKNQVDLLANDFVLEVKGRNLRFDNVANYKYDTIFVESTDGFDRKVHTPHFYVSVSNPTGAIIALDVEQTRDTWTTSQVTDRQRNYSYPMYSAKTSLWIDFDEFVQRLSA